MSEISENAKTILVADDEELIRLFVSKVLKNAGYRVLVADSGEDALRRSGEHNGKIDLLLSNVQMPGITGIELGTRIALQRPEIQVMLMSGFASGMLLLNDGWHFLHKPFVPSQLLSLISGLLKQLPDPESVPDFDEHRRAGR